MLPVDKYGPALFLRILQGLDPAVVRRQATPGPNGAVSIHTDVLCAASKQACDDLVRAFERMTDEANDQARGGDSSGGVGAGE